MPVLSQGQKAVQRAWRWRRLFRSENQGSKRLHDDLVALAERLRWEREWARHQDGNRAEARL